MVTYGTAMSKETSIRYNHIHAEAVQALMNIQIYLQAADLQIDPPTPHGSEDVGGSPQTSQPPETAELTKNTDPDNLMDVSGQTLTGATAENHPGMETTEEQVLELNVPQDDMYQLCEGIVDTPFDTSTTGALREKANSVKTMMYSFIKRPTNNINSQKKSPSLQYYNRHRKSRKRCQIIQYFLLFFHFQRPQLLYQSRTTHP